MGNFFPPSIWYGATHKLDGSLDGLKADIIYDNKFRNGSPVLNHRPQPLAITSGKAKQVCTSTIICTNGRLKVAVK